MADFLAVSGMAFAIIMLVMAFAFGVTCIIGGITGSITISRGGHENTDLNPTPISGSRNNHSGACDIGKP